ncbi:hypothetical protein [Verrucomicrobium sp. BvORR034]|uniref:hypothetical protein n=1 Tax=Verrucomicrobium sp. BvORR034 TaxID=1396418 RepID=UPI00067958F8|nr:hypothetical protein [Verrucomicrobium sp. BvORR034]
MNIKRLLTIAAACSTVVSSSPAQSAEEDLLLKEAAITIKAIWKEWMEKGELVYDKIPAKSHDQYVGTWKGSFLEEDGEEPTKVALTLSSNGTWSSTSLRPEMKAGHWYLYDGMILLFESPISQDADLAFAVIQRGAKTCLLHADSPTGTVELHKTRLK